MADEADGDALCWLGHLLDSDLFCRTNPTPRRCASVSAIAV